jgi:hypothetical protein
MTVAFNHTIVYATDKRRSAEFLANVLGLPKPRAMWSFMTVPLDHGVALDFATDGRRLLSRVSKVASDRQTGQ